MNQKKVLPRTTEVEVRRGFFVKALAILVGGVIGLVPVLAGGLFFVDPLLRRRNAASKKGDAEPEFLRVTTLQALAQDGTPRLFPVVADQQDAWNKFPQTEIGSVFLRRTEGDHIACFNSRCPHLGCTVKYQTSLSSFVCPCHDSSFGLDGSRNNEIPPRDLDALDVEIRDENQVWVRFQKFRAGIPEKKTV
jgi:menaquinol-cytochrome c reductase iron-sulfur subunit